MNRRFVLVLTLVLATACGTGSPPDASTTEPVPSPTHTHADDTGSAPEAPIMKTAKALPALKPAEAKTLGLTLVWTRGERSKGSYSTSTNLKLQDQEVSLTTSHSGRAKGRPAARASAQLTPEQLKEVELLIGELGLDTARTATAMMDARFSYMRASLTVHRDGTTTQTAVTGERGQGKPDIKDDPAYKAVSKLKSKLVSLAESPSLPVE